MSSSLAGCGGCGDDGKGNQLADAPPLVDAPPDMMVQPPPVTLTVTNLGSPAAGVHVYFVNADDTLVKTVDTDASGNASAVMAAGGSVTAINPFSTQVLSPTPRGKGGDELRSFLGVKPGDHLFLTNPDHEFINFQINAQPVEGANAYDVITSCGTSQLVPGGGGGGSGSQDPGGVVQLEDCQGAADIAIIARNQNSETNTLLQGLYHPDATVMADHTLDLTGDDFVSLVNVSLTFSNAPQDVTMFASHAPIGKHGMLAPFSANAGGGTVTLVEPGVPGVTKAVVDLQVSLNSQHEVVDWGDYTLTYMLEMDNLLLAEITDGPSFDVATDKMKWTEASTGQTPDLTTVQLRIQRVEPTGRTWHWSVAAPHPTTGELKLPVLPTDVFDWTPNDGDNIFTNSLTNAKVPGGYDAIRAHIFDISERGNFGDLVVGASGRALLVTALPPR